MLFAYGGSPYASPATMYPSRKPLYAELEKARNSKVLCFVTGDRPGLETQIHPEVYDFFVNHLDLIGVVPKISLVLYTRGGSTLAAWSVVNLVRQFCDEFEVLVPSKAHSSGTLICLGANKVIMTKQATIGPIDPSVNTALNPPVPGAPPAAKFPVSVEALNGFIDFCKDKAGLDPAGLSNVIVKLADHVHPLVLGEVHRSKSQIQMLAKKLMNYHSKSKPEVIDAVVKFLCSESGSHDYTIHRREAISLGLPVEKPSVELYELIKKLYDDISSDLELASKFDPLTHLANNQTAGYRLRRAVVESMNGGSDYFSTEGTLMRVTQQGAPPNAVQDQRQFEGWRHENA
jgi:hypothetical protein